MDKLYNNPWFVKVISFLMAVMLFLVINYDNPNTQPGALPTFTNVSKTLEEVPLLVYYNEDEYAITNIPDHVTVNLRGPQNFLTAIQFRPSYEVYIDLRNLEPGTHLVNVQHRNFPSEVSVNIAPSSVRVTIEEKRTISIPVEIDLLNKAEVIEGYSIGDPIVNPINVEVTAAESVISQVAFAKGFIDLQGATRTIEKSVPVKVYDQQGHELILDINPAVVDVKVPIIMPNKEVPLKVTRIGELPEGLSIRSITTDPKDVTIYGPVNVIDAISFIEGIEVDLSTITENITLQVEVPVPEGVEKISPSEVNVVIEVDVVEELEIEDIPIEVIGLSERLDALIKIPGEGVITLIAMASPETMEIFRKEDVRVYIDVNELSPGEHEVALQITAPHNVTFRKNFTDITVVISEVLSSEEQAQNDNENYESNATEDD